jgi:hypothetical protein
LIIITLTFYLYDDEVEVVVRLAKIVRDDDEVEVE